MALLDHAEMVDAKRFEVIAHASVMSSGRLRFATDAMEMMKLTSVCSIILFSLKPQSADNNKLIEFGAVACPDVDPRGFVVKSSGPYRYISLKNFFIQKGINFKDFTITFEVTDAHEYWEEKPVYRFTMRQTSKPPATKQEELPGIAEASEESFV